MLCLHQVALLGLDLLSALVTRLQERFRAQVGTGKTGAIFVLESFITGSQQNYLNTVKI